MLHTTYRKLVTMPPNYLLYGNFLDIMPNKYNIKNFSGYHFMEKPPKKLLEQVRNVIRLKHYSYKTEKSYVNWIKRYILFHNKRHRARNEWKRN